MCFWVSWQCLLCSADSVHLQSISYVRGIWELQGITMSIFPFELCFIEILGVWRLKLPSKCI